MANTKMRGPKVSPKQSVNNWLRITVVTTGIAATVLLAILAVQIESTAPGNISEERLSRVVLQPKTAIWNQDGQTATFTEAKNQWEHRLKELAYDKQEEHPDEIRARTLIPLYREAEDVSRRLDLIRDSRPELVNDLEVELKAVQAQLSAIDRTSYTD